MKRIIKMAAALGVAAGPALLACPGDAAAPSPDREQVATSQAALAWKLLAPHADDPEALISPASLASALSTVALGASPAMKAALMKALALGDRSPEDAEQRLDGARAALADADPATFITADRFVYPPEIPLSRGILAQFDRRGVSYAAEDLRTEAGIAAVNAWVKQATRGEIDAILATPFPDPTAVALNALFFKAKWKSPFDGKQTAEADFHGRAGAGGRVKMMHRSGHMAAQLAPGFAGVELPFAGDRYAMVIVTTTDAPSPLSRFAAVSGWLSGAGFENREVALSMPRFRLEKGGSLLPALQGDLQAASNSQAPFEGFGSRYKLVDILQRTKVEVDEEGAKAAAVTAVVVATAAMRPALPPVTIVIDKPYLFAIRDRDSGLILVAGYVGKAPSP